MYSDVLSRIPALMLAQHQCLILLFKRLILTVFDPSPIRQGKAISHKHHLQSRANVYHQTWSREMGETLGWPSQQQALWDWKYHHPEPHLLLSSANRRSALSGMCCKIIIQTFFSISSHSSWFSCLASRAAMVVFVRVQGIHTVDYLAWVMALKIVMI
jgi:hypothetical protein